MTAAAALDEAIGPVDQRVANDHDALIVECSEGPNLWGHVRD